MARLLLYVKSHERQQGRIDCIVRQGRAAENLLQFLYLWYIVHPFFRRLRTLVACFASLIMQHG